MCCSGETARRRAWMPRYASTSRAQIRDYVAAGIEPEEARRRARLAFSGIEQIKEECRDAHGMRWMEDLVPRSAIRFADAAAQPGLRDSGDSFAGAGYRRERRDLQPDRRSHAAHAAGARTGAPGTNHQVWGTQPGAFSYPLFEHVRGRTQSFAGIFAQANGVNRNIAHLRYPRGRHRSE